MIYGLAIGAYGAAIAAIATTVSAPPSSAEPWAGTASAVVGSLLVQLVPAGVGCAAGLLVPRIGLACLATIVAPLGVTALLRGTTSGSIAGWVTPLGAATRLVPGPIAALDLFQWLTVVTIWVVLPNAIGARWLQQQRQTPPEAASDR